MQKLVKDKKEELLFATRNENTRLYEVIYRLQYEIERMRKLKRSGKATADVAQLLGDLQFMQYAGEAKVNIIFRDGLFVKLEAIEDANTLDIW